MLVLRLLAWIEHLSVFSNVEQAESTWTPSGPYCSELAADWDRFLSMLQMRTHSTMTMINGKTNPPISMDVMRTRLMGSLDM